MRSPNLDDGGVPLPRREAGRETRTAAGAGSDLDAFARWGADASSVLWGPGPSDGDGDGDERYHGRRRALLRTGDRRTALVAVVSLLAAVGLGTVIALATTGGDGVSWRWVEAVGGAVPTGDGVPSASGSPQPSPSGVVTSPTPGQTTSGPPATFTPVTYEAESGAPVVSLAGSAQVVASAGASGGYVVSGLGNTGEAPPGVLRINSLMVPVAGTYRIAIHYANTGKPSVRSAVVTVSGAAPAAVTFQGAKNCCGVRYVEFVLGAGPHTVTIANSESAAPSIDRVVVSKA